MTGRFQGALGSFNRRAVTRDSRPIRYIACAPGPVFGPPNFGLDGPLTDYTTGVAHLRNNFENRPGDRFMLWLPHGMYDFVGGQGSQPAEQWDQSNQLAHMHSMYHDAITLSRAIKPRLTCDIHAGVWCESPTSLESTRHFDKNLDLAWYLDNIYKWRYFGSVGKGVWFLDAAAIAPFNQTAAVPLRSGHPAMRIGIEAFPLTPGSQIDYGWATRFPSWWVWESIRDFPGGGLTWRAPPPPFPEMQIILTGNSPPDPTFDQLKDFRRRGFIFGSGIGINGERDSLIEDPQGFP